MYPCDCMAIKFHDSLFIYLQKAFSLSPSRDNGIYSVCKCFGRLCIVMCLHFITQCKVLYSFSPSPTTVTMAPALPASSCVGETCPVITGAELSATLYHRYQKYISCTNLLFTLAYLLHAWINLTLAYLLHAWINPTPAYLLHACINLRTW